MTSFLRSYRRIKPECLTIDDLLIKLDRKLEKDAGDRVSEQELSKIIVSKNEFFSKRLYELIPKQYGENPRRVHVVSYIARVVKGDAEAKLRFYFQLVDHDNDERITEAEVKDILKHSVEENRFIFDDHEVDEMAKLVMHNADTDKDGYINFEEFRALFDNYQISEKIGDALESWLLARPVNTSLVSRKTKKISWTYIQNNLSSFIFIIGLIFITFILSVQRIIEYEHSSIALITARVAGQALNFFSSLTLVLVLRRTLTFLRTYGFSPGFLDKTLYYHKLIGFVIVWFSVIHTVGHAIESASSGQNYLFSAHFGTTGLRAVKGTAPLTGWLLWIPLVIIIISSLPMVRKSGHFEVFHYCHLLYVFFWGLLILHGPSFWRWMLIPGSIFLVERWLLIRAKYGRRGKTYVEQAQILPQNVVQLVVKRPPNFYFKPGDWVYVQVPSIARWEWHPFTISSAPEIEDSIWLHIRPVGEWTKKVLSTVQKLESKGIVVFPATDRSERRIKVCDDINGYCVERIGKSKFYLGNVYDDVRIEMTSSTLRTSFKGSKLNEDSFPLSPITSSQFSTTRFQDSFDLMNPYLGRDNDFDTNANLWKKKQPDDVLHAERARELSKRLSVAYPSSNIKLRNQSTVTFLTAPDVANGRCQDPNYELVINKSDYEKMKDMYRSSGIGDLEKEHNSRRILKVDRCLPIRIDGPYGSPSSLIFNSEHAVLISTGIGVTPFASILRSIMMKYLDSRQQCPHCNNWFNQRVPRSVMKLKKVDFVWVNRDQYNLEWFIQLLSQLEIIQAQLEEVNERRFLDMHIYITSAIKSGADIRAAFLRLALDNLNPGRDLITGLKTHTKPGRPDWRDDIKQNSKGRVAVFYCGPPELGRELHHYANLYQFGFHKECSSRGRQLFMYFLEKLIYTR